MGCFLEDSRNIVGALPEDRPLQLLEGPVLPLPPRLQESAPVSEGSFKMGFWHAGFLPWCVA